MRTLTQRELNRALLARQGLLERKEATIPEMLDAMGALQAQYAPSMYIGLWSRLARFEREALTEALNDRSVIQATMMRVTIHLCSRADYWPLLEPIRGARRALWLRTRKDLTEGEMVAAAETLRPRLPLKRKEIDELVGKDIGQGVGLWLDMVRLPPSGTWERRRADLYGLAEDWLPKPELTDPLKHLVTRYLTGFGPAAKADIANWAGLKPAEIGVDDLVTYQAEDGTTLYDLPDQPLPPDDTPAPVRFLPTWDAILLVHARRALILPEEHRPKIFNTKMPQSVGTFLVDGQVKGAWRPDGTIEPFEPLTAKQRKAVEQEARRLVAFCA
ncbi:winged helix DNA-binding domain-containing protein [Solirubrobacter soli]|uniref:winged helix DNA-binding domain-containing protein n=1 Tax=Solirubrobacter soli TaxID=363832 RepID=UPI00040EB6CC|nr:winged helix DNA-binding domain-containing protein [Solirubrobacter soli]